MQKLTLRMEAELVQNAKTYAAVHGKSLSQLVADYFSELTSQSTQEEPNYRTIFNPRFKPAAGF